MVLGAAAVVAVYAAGHQRTAEAARRLDEMERRIPSVPQVASAEIPDAVTAVPSPVPESPVSVAPAPVASTQAVIAADLKTEPDPVPPAAVAPVAVPETVVATVAAPEPAPVPLPAAPVPVTPPAAPAPVVAAQAPVSKGLKDGDWFGWGYCRHGRIKVIVTIAKGRITRAIIDQCTTNYPASYISSLPRQVVNIQSENIDTISGATQSSQAFYYAVQEALNASKAAP